MLSFFFSSPIDTSPSCGPALSLVLVSAPDHWGPRLSRWSVGPQFEYTRDSTACTPSKFPDPESLSHAQRQRWCRRFAERQTLPGTPGYGVGGKL
ncbi:hypothetical protein CKAH01_11050 [Colletotrichum kahawae]|uniref:Uncharacterized protein n=1 Tax=Colletotrichum kahawae TaxID=34407 RepID=A0AAD9XXI2_COLKA|nr:hypothetical protein CKAH01_11050 [Colletotrichum kahawae]